MTITNDTVSNYVHTATADDATPDVCDTSCLITANVNPTTITNFDGGVTGQLLTVVIGDAETTLKHDALTGGAGPILLAGGADLVCGAKEAYQFIRFSGIWHEIRDSRIITPA